MKSNLANSVPALAAGRMKWRLVKAFTLAIAAVLMLCGSVRAEQNLVGWGYNPWGNRVAPTPPSGVTYVAAANGYYSSVALRSDGQVVGFGLNDWGQLNIPALPAGVVYTAVGEGRHHTVLLRSDGQVLSIGWNGYNLNSVPALPAGATKYVQISAGYGHSLALTDDGQIVSWGSNDQGQRNTPALPAGATKWVKVVAGFYHTLGLTDNDQLLGWGYNAWGQSSVPALPAGATKYVTMAAAHYHSLALTDNGQIVGFGHNGWGNTVPPALPAGATKYTDVSTGFYHSLALTDNGKVVAFGYNGNGQTTVPTLPAGTVYSGLSVAMDSEFSLALTHTLVTVTLNGAGEMELLVGGSFTDPGATAMDEDGNNLAVTVTGGPVDVNTPGEYTLTYSATDANGIPGKATRTVTVVKKLASDLWVAMMPSFAQNPAYANVTINDSTKPITVWGRAWNGTPPYSFDLDFGDGTAHYTGSGVSAAAAKFIGTTHVYASSGTKTAKLTVSDSAGHTYTREAKIRVLVTTTHDDRVNMAIEKGLLYLYNNQIVLDANRNYWNVYGWNHQLASGPTGAAVLAFEENGHLPGNDYEDYIYAETVRKGLNHVLDFSVGGRMAIPAHSDGLAVRNSDWNGNGTGAYISDETYANTFGALAIVLSQRSAAAAQNAIVKSGPFAGMSYYELIQDVVEQYAWSQGDHGNRGAYHYYPKNQDNGWDGSTMNWPPLLAKAAQDRWAIQPEAWYIENVKHGFRTMQNANGGIGYGNLNHWVNIAKSGGILVGYSLDGITAAMDAANLGKAVTYIGNVWKNAPSTGGTDAGWIGEFYASYGMKKGLSLGGVETIVSGGVTRDWYQDMSAWLLGDGALLDSPGSFGQPGYRNTGYGFGQIWNPGNWNNSGWISTGGGFSTAHAILILTKSVTVALPIPKIAAIPDQSSKHPANFTLDGSGSSHADPNLSIVLYQWDWNANDGVDWNSPDAVGQTVSVFPNFPQNNPGEWTPGTYTVTLRVTDNNDPANSATTTTTVVVSDTDVAPIAKPIPDAVQPAVYSGNIGDNILIDGTDSYDPDGDVITGWAWDLDGNGTYGDAADAALDTAGNANGPTATLTFTGIYNGTIGLRVTANGKTGTSSSPVNIVATPSDLYVVSLSAANVVQGVSADVTAVVASVAESGQSFTAVNVRFFNGNPFTTGSQIGGNYLVNLPIGGSATVSVTGLPLSPGQEFVYVFLDATSSVDEYDEVNNTARINVSNQPPVAIAQNVTVSAGANCDADVAAAAINNGSSDADGDALTFSVAPAGPYALGDTLVTLSVSDGKVTSTATATITVVDTTAPQISCPADILVNSDAGVCGAVVVFAAPVGTDNCSGATTVQTSGLPSGATFPTGTTVNTFVVTDGAGNQTSCSFTVTVKDSEAPTIACPADVLVNNDAGVCGATVTFAAPSVSDNCSVATVEQTAGLPSGSVFPTGTTVNTFVVTDGSGNQTSCSFSVTVKDAEAPTITCPENIVASNDPDTCSRSNVVFQATASDNCPGVTIAYSIAPGSTFPVGVTPVTVTATDSSGNQTSCTFTVTINLTENPGGLYPIALSAQTLVGVAPGALLPDIYNGTKPGNFGWLTWSTDSNEPTLVKSLTPSGDSFTYQNPADAADNVISIGDWVKGNSGISNSSAVRKALDVLKTIDINVPVWDQTTGNGNNTKYRIVGFAKVRLTSYQLPNQNRISARYLGAACGQ